MSLLLGGVRALKRHPGEPTLAPLQRDAGTMWNEPYLETCCRSALHRLTLVGGGGRPSGLKDGPCLERLQGMGLARLRGDGRFEITTPGEARHAAEILKRAAG
jgi:hypothetical protein